LQSNFPVLLVLAVVLLIVMALMEFLWMGASAWLWDLEEWVPR
jgi:hypothetical protein